MKFLGLDCSTDRLSVALSHGSQRWQHDGEGGAKASATLIPAIMALLTKAQLQLSDLDAIAFGRGPGAFTGLRTACAVAQGLALGAHLPVLPIDSLALLAHTAGSLSPRVLSVLDARMGQVYVAAYEHSTEGWRCLLPPSLSQPDVLKIPASWRDQGFALASNAHALYAEAFSACLRQGGMAIDVWPQALALLDLAELAWARGEAVAPADALPLYVRDKVALTSAERAALKPVQTP